MKKYLYMIAALFGIDYFCKENIEAQKPEDFPRDMEKDPPVPQSQRRFLFWSKKRKERTGPHGAGCLYLGGSGHSDMVIVPGRRQKSRSDRFCPHHGGWFK